MGEEIVTLRVKTEGDQNALKSLEALDKLVEKLNRTPVNINVKGLENLEQAVKKSASSAEQSIKAFQSTALVPVQNQVALIQSQIESAGQSFHNSFSTASRGSNELTEQTHALIGAQTDYNALWSVLNRFLVQTFIKHLGDATDELKAMNAEMVSIQKVTGATDADMERLKNQAFEVAGALGSTPSDYLSSVTKWAQAGYGALSDQLGELSAKTQVVGDVNEETANKFLLAVDAAYKYKGNIDALTRVLDGANEISNNYATSVEKLAGGMGIVSSLAEQAGMKVEETMAAIGTITAKTQESGNSAARALRALILNIQGSTEIEIDAETGERWTEDEIQRTAAALGELNVATREYRDGVLSLRNPMVVIGELAEKYREGLVTEEQLQEVVASLGGKVRSNQLMALIQGYETYTSMIETYRDALGSADQELQIYLDGWEAKSNRLVAQWTEFVESFKASDISMTALDLASALMEVANTPTGRITALAAAMVTLNIALKAFAQTNGGIAAAQVFSGFKTLGADMLAAARDASLAAGGLTTFKGAALGAAAAKQTLSAAINTALGPIGTLVVTLGVISAVYDRFGRQAKKAAKNLADARAEYEESSAKLESLQDELKTTQERIDELNGKDFPTVVEKEELKKLKQQNTELERQIKLQEILNEAKKAERDAAAKDALNKGYSGADMGFFQAATVDFWGDTKDFILRDIQGKGFDEAAKYLENSLDRLNKKKEEFLAEKPNAATWTDSEQKMMEQLDSELAEYQSAAVAFRAEMLQNAADLSDPELVDHWLEVGETLYAAIAPAEALTEKLNRLTGAMDQAEQSRFAQALKELQADGKVTAQEVQVLIGKFPALKVLLEGNAGALDTLAQHFTESADAAREAAGGIQETGDAAEEAERDWESIAASLKKYANQARDVKDAQAELKKNGTLSLDTLIGLLGKYGNAVNDVVIKAMGGMATQEEIFQALERAYQSDADNYRKAMLEKEMDNEDFYSSWLAANADTVKKLGDQYGIDAKSYKTFAQLKQAVESGTQTQLTRIEQDGAGDRVTIFQKIQTAFEDTQDAMVKKAGEAAGAIRGLYMGVANMMAGVVQGLSGPLSALAGPAIDKVNQVKQNQADQAMREILDSFKVPSLGSSKASSKSKGSSGKDYYDQQIDNLKKLEEQTKRTNQVLERSDRDTAQTRIDNLKKVQEQILAAQKQFIARGLAESSDQVNQLKILYAGLGDDIQSIYASMTDAVLERHDYLIWAFEKKDNNQRTAEQIAADDRAMVEEYRKMQEEVHRQAQYYRAQGVRENDKLITELQDRWWEYEKAIRSIYDNLTDAFKDYIDESSHRIEELGRATGNVGKQIEIYAQRIQKAQETIAALQANNIGGANNGKIFDLESQIWGDKDAIRDLQQGLWDELERAFDGIFDGVKEDIDAIQDQMDEINETLERYDKELEGVLKPINAAIEALEKQLEAERKRLEEQTSPLKDQKDALSDRISGYYTVSPDGTIGPYIKGLDDEIDEIQDQIDKANEELDRVNDQWNEQKEREEEALNLQKKQLAVEEAQKAVQDAMLALQTARNERNIYTLKNGVWAWRADEEKVAKAEKALAEAEKAKEEAEKELQDYKEEQAHKQIVKRLEEQIRALEEQKKLLDKQKDLINKQITAIQKQIDAFERESRARQDFIQGLIDRNQAEKEAWEDHYEQLKDQYSQQLDALEEQKKAAEKQYEQWMDAWEDIQKSIETPARSISEILSDIARYGTPAMADQVDRVTDLLRQLGYAIEDVTSGGGYDPDSGGDWGGGGDGPYDGMTRREVIDRMVDNAYAWEAASSQAERDWLYEENQRLGAMIGANYNKASGQWDIFDYSGGGITVKPWAYGDGGVSAPTLAQLENDGFDEYKARNGILTASQPDSPGYSLPPVRPPVAPNYVDNHSVTMNGVTIGTNMLQRPLSDTLRLVGLNMGT